MCVKGFIYIMCGLNHRADKALYKLQPTGPRCYTTVFHAQSAQLRMKFKLLINTEINKIIGNLGLNHQS